MMLLQLALLAVLTPIACSDFRDVVSFNPTAKQQAASAYPVWRTS